MKKILLTLVIVSMLLCALAITVGASEIVNGIYYDLNANGTATVSAENRSSCTLEKVEIPATIDVGGVTYKVTAIANNAFGSVNSGVNGKIKELVIGSYVSSVGEHAFRNITTLEKVTINNTLAETGINFYNAQFYNCTALTNVYAANAKIDKYGDNCFTFCGNLETVDYPSTLTAIGSSCFKDCGSLTSGDLFNTQVKSIGSWAYGSCKSITDFIFPTTLTSIGNNCFLYCPVRTFIFPPQMSSFGKDMLAHMSIDTLVMPALDANDSLNSGFLYTTRPTVILYAGTNIDYFVGLSSAFSAYEIKSFSEYDASAKYTTKTIFYGAITCPSCNGLLGEESLSFNGVFSEMNMVSPCTHCPKENIVTGSYDAMIKLTGYSTPVEYGKKGLAVGFKVNEESVSKYNEETGKAFTFGAYVAGYDNLVNNSVTDIYSYDGAIKAEVTEEELSSFSMRITGFNTEAQLEAKLCIGAYAVVDGVVSYLQAGESEEDSSFLYVTYNLALK